jgi:hypothetical protein
MHHPINRRADRRSWRTQRNTSNVAPIWTRRGCRLVAPGQAKFASDNVGLVRDPPVELCEHERLLEREQLEGVGELAHLHAALDVQG